MNAQLAEFFRRASFYRYHEKFDEYERLYKIRLSDALAESRKLLRSNPPQALQLFRKALASKDNNLIDWRSQDLLLQWAKKEPEIFLRSLEDLWDGDGGLDSRFSNFCQALAQAGTTQTGGQLTVTSTLLMTLSPTNFPPVKTTPLLRAMRLAGAPEFNSGQTAPEKYKHALAFMDSLIEASREYGVELRDRLDAQGVIWCVAGGWTNLPVPDDWTGDSKLQPTILQTESKDTKELLQGRYEIIRQLGAGGMGAVYEAIDQRLKALVAIKEVLVEGDGVKKAFEREASLLANLHHPASPVVTDHFFDENRQFLVMQFVPGDDLAQQLEKRRAPFPVQQVLGWAEELLDALCYLHSNSPPIIHRDIKPSNLKIGRRGQLVLLDFGLAKGTAGQMTTLTNTRSIFGFTPCYASLEQINGEGTDPRSDIYSVGATLYHLMTGVTPATATARYFAWDRDDRDPLAQSDQISSKLMAFLTKSMAMRRKDRFASADEMRNALRSLSRSKTPDRPVQLRQTEITRRATEAFRRDSVVQGIASERERDLRARSKYWFVNVGEGAHRNWDDSRKYGYVSAGGGPQYARAIQKLRTGDRFFAYLSRVGYVGYGEVTQAAVMIGDFVVDDGGKKLLELPLKSPNAGLHAHNPELCEWAVRVHWLKTFPREEAKVLRGVPVYRNVVCKLDHPVTVDFLEREFKVEMTQTDNR